MKKAPPPGFEIIQPILEILDNELRDKVKESNLGKRNTESIWPVHQINWQKSRYVYDMYYTYNRISKKVYEYCVKQKIVDGALIAKWKKPGYERLCSTYVINPANYKFGTTSICRVPIKDRSEMQKTAQDPTTGCLGCASGRDAGPRNIFGNKYGQNLAAVQIARENRMNAAQAKREANHHNDHNDYSLEGKEDDIHTSSHSINTNDENENIVHHHANANDVHDDDGESETDDETSDDDDDYGPTPAAGIWAGSKKLEAESEAIADGDDDNSDGGDDRPTKKVRSN
jgi:bud site selection protein 31